MTRGRLVNVLAACAVLASCRQREAPPPSHAAGPARVLSPSELSPAERQYGHSAWRGPGVTYQPDVVIPPAGAAAVRSLSSDGLVWTLNPDSKGVRDIEAGKVLLLTSRAAGRVLAVQKASDGTRVVLGPLEITDIIRDGNFAFDQPIEFSNVMQVPTPEAFDPPMPVEAIGRAALPDLRRMVLQPAGFTPAATTLHRFTLTPLLGESGLGVRITSDAGGVQFLGQTVLYLKAPRLHFVLDIQSGKIVTSEVQLTGVGGLVVTFEAGMPAPTDANINQKRYASNDFSIPLGGIAGGVPLAINIRQQFLLKTAFSSTGTLKAHGNYSLTGGLRAGFRDGKWQVTGPAGFDTKETILPSIQGVAIGVTGLVITHQLNVIVGIGGWGFVTGPYAYLNSTVTAARGSSVAFDAGNGVLGHGETCRRETVAMGVGAGIGYQIPEPVADAINSILRVFHVGEIKRANGIETKPYVFVNRGWYYPVQPVCGR